MNHWQLLITTTYRSRGGISITSNVVPFATEGLAYVAEQNLLQASGENNSNFYSVEYEVVRLF